MPPSHAHYSVQSIIESGQRGGMLVPVGENFTPTYNREMGEAMELWNAHRWEEGTQKFQKIYRNHPDSPWAVEARMHVACYCRFNALYDEAEEHFLAILEQCADNTAIKKKVLLHLPDVYYRSGRVRAAQAALALFRELPLEWPRKQFLENWSLLYFNAIAADDSLRLCGTKAVALAMEAQKQGGMLRNVSARQVYQKRAWAGQPSSHPDGYSLAELAQVSGGAPRQLTFEELRQLARPGHPVVVHLKAPAEPKLFARLNRPLPRDYRKPSGHFVVVEQAGERTLTILDPDGGRQIWSAPMFNYRWSGLALLPSGQAAQVGQAVDDAVLAQARGGCCGSAPPATANGDPCTEMNGPGAASGGCTTCGRCGGQGAPIYKFGLPNRNVLLEDTPMWYPDTKGPGLGVQLVYNRTESLDGAVYTNVNYYLFGNKWSCNFSCFIRENPSGEFTVILPDGRHEIFTPDSGGYSAAVRNRDRFVITNGVAQLIFDSDKSVFLFDTNMQHVVSMQDRYGNAIQFQYDQNSGQLTQVTDAAGRTLTFSYNDAGCVSQITDAQNRTCTFGYANSNLVSITDMGGYATTIAYDTNNWVTQVSYPNGSVVNFAYTEAAGLGEPYTNYTAPFRIRATDSLNQTHELFYHAFASMGPITIKDQAGNAWLYAHDAVEPYTSVTSDNVNDRPGDGYNRQGEQWEHRDYDTAGNLLKKSIATSTFTTAIGLGNSGSSRDDIAVEYLYDTNNLYVISETLKTNGVVVGVSSNVNDATGNITWHRDLLGGIIQATYDAHDNPTALVNALNKTTSMTYDGTGHLLTLTDARNNTVQWTYDNSGFNTQISFPDSTHIDKTPDNIGRVATVTDPAGLTLSYTYDNLDRMTQVAFPGNTTVEHTYSCCGLEQVKDRLNRRTYFGYDAIGRRNSISNAAGQVLRFAYHPSGQIAAIHQEMDGGAEKTTQFNYTSTNGYSRLTSRVAPSGRISNTYGYSFRGWLTSRTDGLQQQTGYAYDGLGRLLQTTYPDANTVAMGYDVLGRMTSVAGTYASQSQTYDAAGQLTNTTVTLNVPGFSQVSYSVGHGFDDVGNLTSVTVAGAQGFNNVFGASYSYDAMNRVTSAGSTYASANYSFDAGRLVTKAYGNNDVTSYGYDAESRLTSLMTSNGGNRVQGWTNGYNSVGLITSIHDGTTLRSYTYDAINQLTGESGGGASETWTYDAAGNCLADMVAGSLTNVASYSIDNELLAQSTASLTGNVVRGQVSPGPRSNKWYNTWAMAASRSAQVSKVDGTFVISNVPMAAGSNTLAVRVQDVSGNAATQTVGFTKQSAAGTFCYYDANGNLSSSVNGGTTLAYGYDIENRLMGVTSNGVQLLQCWYDSVGRRIAKKEIIGGVTNAVLYVYDGWNVLAVLDQQGQVLEYYTRGPGLGGDIGTLIAETRFSGGTATNTVYYHNNHRGDVTAVRSGTSTVATLDYAAFGNLRSSTGSYSPRFQFSSKELDPAAGLYYYGYRFYAPVFGRWLTQDPLKEAGGLNQYAFCANNSLNIIDPKGQFPVVLFLLIFFAGAEYAVAPENLSQANNPAYVAGQGTVNMVTAAALGGAVNGVFRATASCVRGLAAKNTTLYRAVKPGELADIQKTGQLINRGSAEGKYFTSSAADASAYAKKAVSAFKDPPYTIIKTEVPTASLPTPVSVDGGIPAYVMPNEALPGLTPQVMPTMPIPGVR